MRSGVLWLLVEVVMLIGMPSVDVDGEELLPTHSHASLVSP